MRRIFIRILWWLLGSTVVLGALGFIAIWNGWIGYMPDIESLQNPISRYPSLVYSADGKLMGTFATIREKGMPVSFNNMSSHLIHALVATEDERFYEHSGIDFIALSRAIVKRGFMGNESAGGGSTITQQLAKQLYSERAHSTAERLLQKPIEWVIAIKLEKFYTKEEIITMYLNYFDFLNNAVGIKTAANTYFGKEPKSLNAPEAATLIGLCKNPAYYNPFKFKDRCKERRNVVLQQMNKMGYISDAELEQYKNLPLNVVQRQQGTNKNPIQEGIAPYFRDYIRQYMMAEKPDRKNYPDWKKVQYHLDSIAWEEDPLYGWCNKNLKRNGHPYNLNTDGLRIFTTVDSRMQRYAEEAVREHLSQTLQPIFDAQTRANPRGPFSSRMSKEDYERVMNRAIRQSIRYQTLKAAGATEEEIRKSFNTPVKMMVFSYKGDVEKVMSPMDSIKYYKQFLRAGLVSMDPKTGAIKAYVGGPNYEYFQYDMAMVGRRQVGSTMKPYLYSLAMQNGYNPCDKIPNRMKKYGNWMPKGGGGLGNGSIVTLKQGLAASSNWCSAHLIEKFTPQNLVDLLHKYGLNNPNIQPNMALCLGPCEVTVGEMVSGYSTFVNKGMRSAPLMVTRIEDSDGHVLANFQPRYNEVISEESSYKMLTLLKGVVDRGTGRRVRGFGISAEMGGKTGTTNSNADAWFMGVTPDLVNGVWVGGEDRDIHFVSTGIGQGAAAALPIWGRYMRKVYSDASLDYSQSVKFDVPKGFDPCDEKNVSPENSIGDVFE